MNSTFKDFIVPGSPLFLLVALVPGVVLLYRQHTRLWGQIWLTILLMLYWAMSTPAVARLTAAWMGGGFAPISSPEQARGATAIVVLGGGSFRYRARGAEVEAVANQSAFRILEAARVYRLLGQPWVIVTGGLNDGGPGSRSEGEVMSERLIALGVSADRILQEAKARNTHDHAVYVPQILKAHQIQRFVLVTSPTHMRRSLKVFAAAGMTPVPSVASAMVDPTPDDPWWEACLPSPAALELSQAVMYDLMGTAYYWTRGWI